MSLPNEEPTSRGPDCPWHGLCANLQGFSLHAAAGCGADDRRSLQPLCRCITRRALAYQLVQGNAAGRRGTFAPGSYHCSSTRSQAMPTPKNMPATAIIRVSDALPVTPSRPPPAPRGH